jgi:hypothetical protein
VLLTVLTVFSLHLVRYSNEPEDNGDCLQDKPQADRFPAEAEMFRFAATSKLLLRPIQPPSEWDTESTEAWA